MVDGGTPFACGDGQQKKEQGGGISPLFGMWRGPKQAKKIDQYMPYPVHSAEGVRRQITETLTALL